MEAFSKLIDMGGYGAFVWPAYLVTAVVMIALVVESRRRIARNESLLRDLEALRGTGREGGQAEGSDET